MLMLSCASSIQLFEPSPCFLLTHFAPNQDLSKKVQSQKPNLEEINREADKLLDSGRLDQGDVVRVERHKQALGTRYTAIGDRLLGIKNK